MSTHRVGFRRVAAIAALVSLALAATACSTGGGSGSGTGAAGGSAGAGALKLDTAKAVEQEVGAADGGAFDVALDGAKARVIFPNDALSSTTTIVATPLSEAPSGEGDVVVKGFQLEEKGTGAGPKLAYPAWVVVAVTEKLGDDVALVTYTDTGYEVLPTKVTVGANGTVLTGLATHFSPTGARRVGKDKANKARQKFADFNWVVYIRDTQQKQTGPMKQSITLTLRAVNAGGDIDGDYTGNATIKSKNFMSAGGGTGKADFTGKSTSVKLKVIVGTLAPLTPPSTTDQGIPLAPLSPEPDWSGGGTIEMSAMMAGGTGTVTGGGYSVSKGLKDTSSVPVDLAMWGPQVTLTANLPVGAVTFRGFIRGEGKK